MERFPATRPSLTDIAYRLGATLIAAVLASCSSSSTGTPFAANNGGGSESTLGGQTNSGGSSPSGGATIGGTAGAGGGTGGSGGSNVVGGSGGFPAGGTPGGDGGAPPGGAGGATPFVLSWQDDFNSLDLSAWQLENFTYDGNEAQFSPQNASVSNGILTIALTPAPSGSAKPFLGVEMRSIKTLTYGKVSARMRFAKGSGIVSGLVLFYTPFPNCNWNEIDIEHLGNTSNSSQLNDMVYLGAPVPNCIASVTPTQDPLIVSLGFDAESDFHIYDVEWTPSGVKFFGDGALLRTWTKNIGLLTLPQNILLTIWASNAATWAGPITATSAPTSADVDWIKVYDFTG